jgi:hypothetical protein
MTRLEASGSNSNLRRREPNQRPRGGRRHRGKGRRSGRNGLQPLFECGALSLDHACLHSEPRAIFSSCSAGGVELEGVVAMPSAVLESLTDNRFPLRRRNGSASLPTQHARVQARRPDRNVYPSGDGRSPLKRLLTKRTSRWKFCAGAAPDPHEPTCERRAGCNWHVDEPV